MINRLDILLLADENYNWDRLQSIVDSFKVQNLIAHDTIPDAKRFNTITFYNGDVTPPKSLVTIPADKDDNFIREVIKLILSGQFDDAKKGESFIYQGGAPSDRNSFISMPWDIGVTNIFSDIADFIKMNWMPWWGFAALAAVFSIRAASSKRLFCQAVCGSASAYFGYRVFKKLSSK